MSIYKNRKLLHVATIAITAVTLMVLFSLGSLFGSGPVSTYTGCLNTQSGLITDIQEGSEPLKPCKGKNKVEISFSAGTITSITAGVGLEGGGDNGDITLSLGSTY